MSILLNYGVRVVGPVYDINAGFLASIAVSCIVIFLMILHLLRIDTFNSRNIICVVIYILFFYFFVIYLLTSFPCFKILFWHTDLRRNIVAEHNF